MHVWPPGVTPTSSGQQQLHELLRLKRCNFLQGQKRPAPDGGEERSPMVGLPGVVGHVDGPGR